MAPKNPDQASLSLAPTKAFFVEMLTRDIELEDAILDLLDNCVDGALRSTGYQPDAQRPYEGYWADLKFAANEFSISDNCGGISNTVRQSAFRLGRPPTSKTDKNLPTVGIYGIGMKRAIFKLGYTCTIETHTKTTGFQVDISKEWLRAEGLWDIPVKELPGKTKPGTTITVRDLRDDVRESFGSSGAFDSIFRPKVAEYYSLLIDKGFEVRIEGQPVKPMSITLRSTDLTAFASENGAPGIAPYIYEGNSEGVRVNVAVGFYSPYNIDPDEEPTKGKSEEAGWTVICNDRVVLSRDKTLLTGWGDGAPNYHPQFRQIAGVVEFSSKNPELLPITTTKRGVDGQNLIYLQTRKKMRDGLLIFTSFTNTLKEMAEEERTAYFRAAAPSSLRTLKQESKKLTAAQWTSERGGFHGRSFRPPLPKVKDSGIRKMVFSRKIDAIKEVAAVLFEDSDQKPSDVAAEAFDEILRQTGKVK
jgi:hypothetical protein